MWDTSSLWLEVALLSATVALGHIGLGHFEVKTSRLKKLLKYLFMLALVVSLSALFGRGVALGVYGLSLLPVLYIHLIDLPRKGVNGLPGEPKDRYYALRGWEEHSGGR